MRDNAAGERSGHGPTTCGAVILGAGFGRRFGSDKRIAQLGEHTVAEHTVARYAEVFDIVRVVMRAEDHHVAELLQRFDVEIVRTHDAHLGMGHSLAAGIDGVSWDWAFIALLDMPFISHASLRELRQRAAALDHPAIIRPRYDQAPQTTAHPIGFHAAFFNELGRCQGDTGARAVLQNHTSEVIEVFTSDPGTVRDIDAPEDLSVSDQAPATNHT